MPLHKTGAIFAGSTLKPKPMARVLSPRLRVGTTDRDYVDVHIDFSVDFDPEEAGFRYRVRAEFHSIDRGPNTWIPDAFFTKVFTDEIIATRGRTNHSRKIRFTREILNEDKNGKDEIYAVVEMVPVAPRFGARTPELKYEFERGKGHRNN